MEARVRHCERGRMHGQRGATLVLTALCLTALLGAAALAVDVGLIAHAKQRAQDVADAAALAGGQLLPDTAGADAAATQVIGANGGGSGGFVATGVSSPGSVTLADGSAVTAAGAGDALLVQGYGDAPLAFGPAVGYGPASQTGAPNTLSVPTQAAVVIEAACGLPVGAGVAPFGLIGDDPSSADPTARYVATLLSTAAGAQTPRPKVYQPTTSYGGQPLVLRQNVFSGGTRVLAGNFDPLQIGMAQGYQGSIFNTTDAPLSAGQSVSVQATATIGLTQSGLGARLAPSDAQFTHDDTASPAYVNWFFGNQSLPVDTSQKPVTDPNTGQTYSYRLDPHRQEATDGHVLIVPVIRQSAKNGTGPVTILAFAAFFVEQPYANKNNNAIAQGRFIGLTPAGAGGGSCAGAGAQTPPRLVE